MSKVLNLPRSILLGIVLLLLIASGSLMWWGRTTTQPPATTSHQTSKPTTAIIEITTTGFTPATLNVHPHTDIVWVNEDTMPHLPAADPYPSHSSLPELVAPKALGIHETYSFLVTKPETIHYHDDLNPTLTGTVRVE